MSEDMLAFVIGAPLGVLVGLIVIRFDYCKRNGISFFPRKYKYEDSEIRLTITNADGTKELDVNILDYAEDNVIESLIVNDGGVHVNGKKIEAKSNEG